MSRVFYIIVCAFISCFTISCNGDLKDDIKGLQDDFNDLNEKLNIMQEAYESGELVINVISQQDTAWLIVFSDNSSLLLPNGIIKNVAQNEEDEVVVFTLQNDQTYSFNLKISYPTGIIVLQSQLEIGKNSVGYIDFRINPSDAKLNYDVSSEKCELALDVVGKTKVQTKTYVTTPANYRLTAIQPASDKEGNIMLGQYRAFIGDNGKDEEYMEQVAFVVSTKNGKGDPIQLSSDIVTISRKIQSSADLLEFKFKTDLNTDYIQYDLSGEIEKDKITVHIPYYTDCSHLVATFKTNGSKVLVEEAEQESDVSVNDFSSPVLYKVVAEDGSIKQYTVSVTRFTGLPVMFISTGNAGIHDKENWVASTMRIDGGLEYDDYESDEVYVRGRGNTTWSLPKKPYAVKLGKKAGLLGMPKHKRWVLLANYNDKSMLRTTVAFMMSEKVSSLAYTPRIRFVELFLDDVYMGTYQLCEHIKVDENRVNVTDDGYIVEVDQLNRMGEDDIYFQTPRLLFNIKEPEVERNSEAYNFIKDYVTRAEEAIYGDNFKDPVNGYAKYLDVQSFVDWYLVNEITKNNDAVFFSSCFMNYKPGEKLRMGPVWDFDISSGNINYNGNEDPLGFWVSRASWISRLFEDPAFADLVRERYRLFYSRKNEIMQCINENSTYIKWSVVENNAKWNVLYNYAGPNYVIWGNYNNEVQYLKNWLNTRMDWLHTVFESW